jgi:hypothetical protein
MPARATLALALTLLSAAARADEVTVVLQGDPSNPVTARVRTELEALGHRVVTAAADDARGRVTLTVAPDRLAATVAMRDRPATEVVTLASTRDAAAVFALRVGEAVRAGMIPVVAPLPAPPVIAEPTLGVAIGARMSLSPGGVGPIVAPAATLRWTRRLTVALSLAPGSWGGEAAGPSTLRVFSAAVGLAVGLPLHGPLRGELGVRAEYLQFTHTRDGDGVEPQRDGVVAASLTAAARWRAHRRFALRSEVAVGLTLAEVLLVRRDRSVAEWGRPLVGAQLDAELLF